MVQFHVLELIYAMAFSKEVVSLEPCKHPSWKGCGICVAANDLYVSWSC